MNSTCQLAVRGDSPVLAARDPDRGRAAAEDLRARDGVEVDVVRLDVTDPDSCWAAADEVRDLRGRVDVLVNNAGRAFVVHGDLIDALEVGVRGNGGGNAPATLGEQLRVGRGENVTVQIRISPRRRPNANGDVRHRWLTLPPATAGSPSAATPAAR